MSIHWVKLIGSSGMGHYDGLGAPNPDEAHPGDNLWSPVERTGPKPIAERNCMDLTIEGITALLHASVAGLELIRDEEPSEGPD